MAKKKSKRRPVRKSRRSAGSLPTRHLLLVAAFAALVCLLPWPGGWGFADFWIRAAVGVAASLLFYLLVRWIMKDPYPAWLSVLLLLSFTAVWMPFGRGWRPWALLFPLSFALGTLYSRWDATLHKGKGGFRLLLFAAITGLLTLGAVLLSTLVCLRVWHGAVPMLSGLLIAAVAVGVVLLAVSAFTRRQPWDLVLGLVLYAVVWKLLGFPGFESFL